MSPLQQVFAKRLNQLLEERGWSANRLAKEAKARGFRLGQRSVSRMLELKQDPTLQKVHEISQTMDVSVASLLGGEMPAHNVVKLPDRYPRWSSRKPEDTGKLRTNTGRKAKKS